MSPAEEIQLLKRMLERERRARKAAEDTLEQKAGEIFQSHQALRDINVELEKIIKQRTEELIATENRFSSIIESASDIIFRCDAKGNFLYLNPIGIKKLGYSLREFTSFHFAKVVERNHRKRLIDFYRNQAANKSVETYLEFPVKTKSGKILWIGQNIYFHFRENGQLEYVSGVARDISDSVKTTSRLKNLISSLHSGILLEDENRRIVLTNSTFTEMFKINADPSLLIGADCSNSAEESKYHFADEAQFVQRIEKIIRDKVPVLGDRLQLKNGRVLERDYIPIYIEEFYSGHLWNYRDVTDEQETLRKIQYSEEKYRNIIANMNLGLIEVDLNDFIVTSNHTFSEMSGYSQEELIGKKASDLLLTDETKLVLIEKAKLRKQGIADAYELPIIVKNQERKWWLISGAPAFDINGVQTGSIGIHLDITAQKKLAQELEIAKVQAEASAQAKEIFLANMSHEIRTPMNGIMGMLNQLSKADLNEKNRMYLNNIFIAADHLLKILNDILDMSKIEAGKLDLDFISFGLDEILQRVKYILAPKVEEKGIALNLDIDHKIFSNLIGDPHRLVQLCLNLAGNAVKFTDKGSVVIAAKLMDDQDKSQLIRFTISDTGIGMDQEYMAKIFEKFTQEDRSVTRKYGGTGLGMSISRELINLMGGQMHLESIKGQGTSISFDLRFEKYTQDKKSYIEKLELEYDSESLKGKSILLAEDNDMNQIVVQVICDILSVNLSLANNGEKAVDLAKNNNYDLILMDMHMPVKSGIEATKEIRNIGINAPIIALTANAMKRDLDKCLESGMNDFLTKPFEEKQFIAILNKWIGDWLIPQEISSQFSFTKLENMAAGNVSFVVKLVEIFLKRAPESLYDIEQAINKDDFEQVAFFAHKMKPVFENLGMIEIMHAYGELERLALSTQNKPRIQLILKRVSQALEKAIPQIASRLNMLQKSLKID